jgi:YYY domain-containing protein
MSDLTAVLIWWVLVQLFGLSVLPLTLRLFRPLSDRGYGVNKALGLLLPGYLFWLLNVLGFLRNESGSMWLALAAIALISLLFYRRATLHPRADLALSAWLRANWKLILVTELVFAATFVAGALYRAHVPRIMTAGGEKFMELAFLNGIRRSETLPPLDPWLSGFAISYYYFGYLLMSILIRLSGVPPSVGFNLGGGLLFALTATGAFSVVYNLVARKGAPPGRIRDEETGEASPQSKLGTWVAIALLGTVFLVLLSNLAGALEAAHWNGLGSPEVWEWLDIADLDQPPPQETGVRATRSGWWWWRASRVIFDYNLQDWPNRFDKAAEPSPHRRENIDEFPFFSFLLGDMHPHVLALPFIMLVLTMSLTLFEWGRRETDPRALSLDRENRVELFLFTLIFGALGFLNTWDLPIQWLVAIGAYILGRLGRPWAAPPSEDDKPARPLEGLRPHLRPILTLAGTLAIGGLLLYAPFYIGFQSQAGGLLAHVHSSTRLAHFVVMFGPLLFILIPFLVWGIARAWRARTLALRAGLWVGALVLLLALGLLLATALAIILSPSVRGLIAPGLADQAPSSIALRYLGMRLSTPWVTLLLTGMISAVTALLLPILQTCKSTHETAHTPAFSRTAQLSLLLIIAGAVMTLAPEYVYLKDVFGVRINTIFKFYYQAWVLWAIAAAGAVYVLLAEDGGLRALPRWLFGGGLALNIALGLVYPLLAVPDRVQEFPKAPTLDGTAYMAQDYPADYAAIQWLNKHVEGAPVILEKPGGAYQYEGRVSAQTGLPTLLGWAGHERQWRGNTIEQDKRTAAIQELFTSADPQRTLTLLDEYDITYVYVGSLERAEFSADALQNLERLMQVVYERDGVKIYQRRQASLQAGDNLQTNTIQ